MTEGKRSGSTAGRLVDGEIVEGEPAGHGRAQRLGFDHGFVTGVSIGGGGSPGAVDDHGDAFIGRPLASQATSTVVCREADSVAVLVL